MCEFRLIIVLLRLSCPTQTLEHGRAVTMTTRAARGAPSSRVQGSGGGRGGQCGHGHRRVVHRRQ